MWTKDFWVDAAERSIRSAAVALVSLWVGSGPLNAFSVNWTEALGVAAGAAVLQLVLSLAAAPVGQNGTAAFVPTKEGM